MKVWVKQATETEDDALKVILDADADASDLIQEVVKLFAFDNNVTLRASQVIICTACGVPLSNRTALAPYSSGTFVVRPKEGCTRVTSESCHSSAGSTASCARESLQKGPRIKRNSRNTDDDMMLSPCRDAPVEGGCENTHPQSSSVSSKRGTATAVKRVPMPHHHQKSAVLRAANVNTAMPDAPGQPANALLRQFGSSEAILDHPRKLPSTTSHAQRAHDWAAVQSSPAARPPPAVPLRRPSHPNGTDAENARKADGECAAYAVRPVRFPSAGKPPVPEASQPQQQQHASVLTKLSAIWDSLDPSQAAMSPASHGHPPSPAHMTARGSHRRDSQGNTTPRRQSELEHPRGLEADGSINLSPIPVAAKRPPPTAAATTRSESLASGRAAAAAAAAAAVVVGREPRDAPRPPPADPPSRRGHRSVLEQHQLQQLQEQQQQQMQQQPGGRRDSMQQQQQGGYRQPRDTPATPPYHPLHGSSPRTILSPRSAAQPVTVAPVLSCSEFKQSPHQAAACAACRLPRAAHSVAAGGAPPPQRSSSTGRPSGPGPLPPPAPLGCRTAIMNSRSLSPPPDPSVPPTPLAA
ncbi:hypothetical protein DIPPA_09457 [Diplonema papillatum]|nr:hypothetical protein DIPPA_09457 [Diplonema papillatum]